MTLHIALVEWDSSMDPEIILGPTWHGVAAAAASAVSDPERCDPPGDWENVREELPLTREVLDDERKLLAWHGAFRGGVTVPWVSFYVHGHPDSRQAVSSHGASWAEDDAEHDAFLASITPPDSAVPTT